MSSLADDLARIAAARGKPLNYYTGRERTPAAIPPHLLAILFTMTPNFKGDLRAYDSLPEEARRFVSECPLQINAAVFRLALVSAGDDEERLEGEVQAQIPGRVKAWLLRHYGRDHPSVRKYP